MEDKNKSDKGTFKEKAEKNKEYIMDITGMGFEGEGVGKINDFTVFVPGALSGEKVKIKIVKVNKNYGFGKLMDIIAPSEKRVKPECIVSEKCGGCQLQHMDYNGQLEFKRNRVKDCIERIGKLKNVDVHPTIGMEKPYRYRNKVQLPVGKNEGKLNIGFYSARSHRIINMNSCEIQDKAADKVISIFRNWMEDFNIAPYNEETGSGIIRHIMVRKGFTTRDVMVVIVTNGYELPFSNKLIDLLICNIEGLKSIIQNINTVDTNVVLGKENKVLWGKATIADYIGDFKFNISPLSFFQVNPVQTRVLYEKALEYADLTGNETVFDAYCGTGTISLFLSKKAKKVYGVEIVPQAIENAIENAAENHVSNVEFLVGESEKIIPQMINQGVRADVVVVDPPRKGCAPELLNAIGQMQPEKIVYVSCDPATLARDLGILDSLGFETLEAQPVDMFPHTASIETVAKLKRRARETATRGTVTEI